MENYMKELNKSIDKHIKMLNFMLSYKDADDVCSITQNEIAEYLGVGRTTVKNMIDRLNTIDDCVEKVGKSKYKVHYVELRERGIFKEILRCLPQFLLWILDGTSEKINYIEKAKRLNTTVKVVSIIEGYIVYEYNHSEVDPHN